MFELLLMLLGSYWPVMTLDEADLLGGPTPPR